MQQGEYAAAAQAFAQELKVSEEFGDQAQAGLAHEDLGLLLMRQGRHPEALKHLEQCYEISKSLGLKKYVATSLVHRANALWRLGHYDDARNALNEMSSFALQPDAPRNVSALYHLALARMALSERRFPEAITNSQKALTLADTQLKRVSLMANFTSGLAQAMTGSSAGRPKCDQAVANAREIGDPLLLSESLLMLAEAQLNSGDHAAALKAAHEARELAARIGSPDTELMACLIAARASRDAKDSYRAQEYASRANTLLQSFEQLWGSTEYNLFVNRPDIQFSRTQVNQLLAQKS